MISNMNKLRKINSSSYQIIGQKTLPCLYEQQQKSSSSTTINNNSKQNKVVSVSINNQGKYLLIIMLKQVLVLNSQNLDIIMYKILNDNIVNKNTNKIVNIKTRKYQCGFNSHKKSLYFMNPLSYYIQFYSIKDLNTAQFIIRPDYSQQIIKIQYNNNLIHILTSTQYQLYEQQNLIKVIPIQYQFLYNKTYKPNCIDFIYPLICKNIYDNSLQQSYLQLSVINKSGLCEKIKMPQKVNHIQISKPVFIDQQQAYKGEIVCSGENSYGLYVVKYMLLNVGKQIYSVNNDIGVQQKQQHNYQISIINSKHNNNNITHNNEFMDISFSQNNTQINYQHKINNKSKNIINPQYYYQKQQLQAPKQLKKLYEQEQKIFQQCKDVIFGNFFDNSKHKNNNNQQQEYYEQNQHNQQQYEGDINNLDSKNSIKIRLFYGFQSHQSLNLNHSSNIKLGNFYWSSQYKLMSLLTNNIKSLLIHQFSQPCICHKLIHLYSKPTSIFWSHLPKTITTSISTLEYYIIAHGPILKLYNIKSKFGFIRNIQIELLVKDSHVIFDGFVTNDNGYIVVCTYKRPSQNAIKNIKENNTKLYIFVIQLSTSKIVSSSYKQIKHIPYKNSTNIKNIQQYITTTYSLQPNRYSSLLQFILVSSSQLSFYRVTSMFTIQVLQLQQLSQITKQQTQSITMSKYIQIDNDNYLLLGSQNGSLIVIDARTGAVIVVLVGLVEQLKGNNSKSIIGIQFIQCSLQQTHSVNKLIVYASNSNIIKIYPLHNGLNTLIQQLQPSTNLLNSNTSFSQSESSVSHLHNHKSNNMNNSNNSIILNLDSDIYSISEINNTQQLIITKSGTLWLVDYDDYCTIKILSVHEDIVNEAYLISLRQNNNIEDNSKQQQQQQQHNNINSQQQNQLYILSCSSNGYIKLSDLNKSQQLLQIYKPRKNASCINIQGEYFICAFKNQLYFYNHINQQNHTLQYLGSLQFQINQIILKVKNIPQSRNYYVLTDSKVYMIYVKRKNNISKHNNNNNNKINNNTKFANKNQTSISNTHNMNKQIQKVHIQIQIKQITNFNINNNNQKLIPLNLQLNIYNPYNEFSIIFKYFKLQTWSRKCLKRTLNPLEQLSQIQQLQYYLIDVYQRKDIKQCSIQFISDKQYIVSLPEMYKLQIRNYKEHTLVGDVQFNEDAIGKIKSIKYVANDNRNFNHLHGGYLHSQFNNNTSTVWKNIIGKNMAIIFIGDQNGYINICDINGLVIQRQKVFNTPIEIIQFPKYSTLNNHKNKKKNIQLLVKSQKYISVIQIKTNK